MRETTAPEETGYPASSIHLSLLSAEAVDAASPSSAALSPVGAPSGFTHCEALDPFNPGVSRDEVVDYIRDHPGCSFVDMCDHFNPKSTVGFMVFLHELWSEGTIVMVPGVPLSQHFLPEAA
ncbi:MAG: hypothetical protein Q4Q62_06020 [Thermoplasmata archaeon]|nr:hypothetical protein [Thermoplasmata archaeon]